MNINTNTNRKGIGKEIDEISKCQQPTKKPTRSPSLHRAWMCRVAGRARMSGLGFLAGGCVMSRREWMKSAWVEGQVGGGLVVVRVVWWWEGGRLE